jgi:small conductance mechanosensitive channel
MHAIIEYILTGLDTAIRFAPRLAIGIALLVVGWKGSGLIAGWLSKILEKREVDATLIPFLSTVVSTLIKAAVVISVISYIGIPPPRSSR